MGNLGVSELLVIAAVALLVIGPRRLPEVARGLGEAVRAFQKALSGSPKEGG
jgi:sec-independent protein translocase protein TatA